MSTYITDTHLHFKNAGSLPTFPITYRQGQKMFQAYLETMEQQEAYEKWANNLSDFICNDISAEVKKRRPSVSYKVWWVYHRATGYKLMNMTKPHSVTNKPEYIKKAIAKLNRLSSKYGHDAIFIKDSHDHETIEEKEETQGEQKGANHPQEEQQESEPQNSQEDSSSQNKTTNDNPLKQDSEEIKQPQSQSENSLVEDEARNGDPDANSDPSDKHGLETANSASENAFEEVNSQTAEAQVKNSDKTAMSENSCDESKQQCFLNGDRPRDSIAKDIENPTTAGTGDKQKQESFHLSDEHGDSDNDSADSACDDSDNPADVDSENLDDDCPTHQKKWGKSFKKEKAGQLSRSPNSNRGIATAELKGTQVTPQLLKLCRRRLDILTGDASNSTSPRYEYQEFCQRFLTARNPVRARKEETGRPVILLLADISGSCASFSEESVKVAKAASKLGSATNEIMVLTHYNGEPHELEINGKAIALNTIYQVNYQVSEQRRSQRQSRKAHLEQHYIWYDRLLARYPIEVIIALGDWDAAREYGYLASQAQVNRFVWLDNAHCTARGTVKNQTKSALLWLKEHGIETQLLKGKLTYKDGCKDAIAFIDNIR